MNARHQHGHAFRSAARWHHARVVDLPGRTAWRESSAWRSAAAEFASNERLSRERCERSDRGRMRRTGRIAARSPVCRRQPLKAIARRPTLTSAARARRRSCRRKRAVVPHLDSRSDNARRVEVLPGLAVHAPHAAPGRLPGCAVIAERLRVVRHVGDRTSGRKPITPDNAPRIPAIGARRQTRRSMPAGRGNLDDGSITIAGNGRIAQADACALVVAVDRDRHACPMNKSRDQPGKSSTEERRRGRREKSLRARK